MIKCIGAISRLIVIRQNDPTFFDIVQLFWYVQPVNEKIMRLCDGFLIPRLSRNSFKNKLPVWKYVTLERACSLLTVTLSPKILNFFFKCFFFDFYFGRKSVASLAERYPFLRSLTFPLKSGSSSSDSPRSTYDPTVLTVIQYNNFFFFNLSTSNLEYCSISPLSSCRHSINKFQHLRAKIILKYYSTVRRQWHSVWRLF